MKHPIQTPADIEALQFNEAGLVPVVAQDHATGAVLMLAWANMDALKRSIESGKMTYFSRSRKQIWTKGETSGNTQKLVSLQADCDHDAVLAIVHQAGPACHENTGTCWSAEADTPVATILGALDRLAQGRVEKPQGRYTDELLASPELVASKVEEEAAEVGAVLRGLDNDDSLEHEAADLLYHLVVALRGSGSSLHGALRELMQRE